MMDKTKKIGGKSLYIIVSFLVAVGIWFYVDSMKGYAASVTIEDVPVEFIGEETVLADRGLMLLPDSQQTITLTLEGRRTDIMQIHPDRVRVQADLKNVTSTGTATLTPQTVYPDTQLFRRLTMVSASPYSISVDVGELYSKEVEIRCDIQGKVADGYIAGELKLDPEVIVIRGQEPDVNAVSYAKVTLVADNASESVIQSLEYTLYDKNDQELSGENLHTTVQQIQVTLPVNVVRELPLKINFIEAPGCSLSNVDYTLDPLSITVSGDAAVLADVSELVLDDFSLEELTGTMTYNYVIALPAGCQNLSGVNRATLKIAFRDMSSSTLAVSHFELTNLPEGKQVTVLTSELMVTLRGPSTDVVATTAEGLTAVADLSDVSSASGSYTVPATIRIDSGGDVGVVGTYQINVTIADNAEEGETDTP